MSGAPVRLRREEDGVAVVTLEHPPLNLFDAEVFAGFEAAVAELERDVPRVALFRAIGPVVSAGVDVRKVFDGLDRDGAERLWTDLIAFSDRVEALPCATIFAAHALCLTAAFEIALACDLIVAAESARFGLVEIVVGLTPSMGGTQRLAERAGSGRARELVLTGGLFDAATLERWNVVNRVHPDDELEGRARGLAAQLAAGPPLAQRATKLVIAAFREGGVTEANARVAAISADLFETEDLRNAVQTFVEQGPGKATFEGR